MGQLSLPRPVPVDRLVGVDHPVHDSESQHRPRKGLPYRSRVVSVEPVSPRVDEVPPACEHRTVFVARMVLASEGRSPDVQPCHPLLEPIGVETGFFGRDAFPVLIRIGHPVGYGCAHGLLLVRLRSFKARLRRSASPCDTPLPTLPRAARGIPAMFEWSCSPVVRTAE